MTLSLTGVQHDAAIARISLKLFAAILLTNVLIGGMSLLLIVRSYRVGYQHQPDA